MLEFVRTQVEERKRGQFEDTAFLDHLMEAKEKDGSPTYPDQRDITSETRLLVVAGMHTPNPLFKPSPKHS